MMGKTIAIASVLLLVALGIGSSALIGSGEEASAETLGWPIARADERPRLLTFGLYVTPDPAQNPINPPERFTGYHAGLDFETLPDEAGNDVAVYAACDGPVAYAQWTEGYGGLVIQRCRLSGDPVTVLYGHLKIDSVRAATEDRLRQGDTIGFLGDHSSEQTDGTRKHLHFAVHRGDVLELTGYAQERSELAAYIDPAIALAL